MIGQHFHWTCEACKAGRGGICLDTPPATLACPKCGSLCKVISDGPKKAHGPVRPFAEIMA